ncbi:SUMF1/EgtB/PvdO family nonheme iron enzyme [Endothiovibrio diazotrophicus]
MSSRADLLRTLRAGERIAGDDGSRAARLAALLGYACDDAVPMRPGGEADSSTPADRGRSDGEAPPEGALRTARRPTFAWVVTACEALKTEKSESPDGPLPLLDPAPQPRSRAFIAAPPLRSRGQWQNLWDEVIVGHGQGRRIDLPRCLRDLTRARPVGRLPLLPRRHFNGPITLLIDRPQSLRQVHPDLYAAWRSLVALVGSPGLTAFQLRNGPDGAWEQLDGHFSPADEGAIQRHSQVLLLGAFGALHDGRIAAEWLALIRRLKARGHPVRLLPVCHLRDAPAPCTPLDPRGARDGGDGPRHLDTLLALLSRTWKTGREQLRYLRHALPGAGVQAELALANHPEVRDSGSYLELGVRRLLPALHAFDALEERLRIPLQRALDQWRGTLNARAEEMERLQSALLEAPKPHQFPRLLRQLEGLRGRPPASAEVPIGLAAYLPLLDQLARQHPLPDWQPLFRLARQAAWVLGEPLPGGYHAEEFAEPESPAPRWLCQIGTGLQVRARAERALLPLGAHPYSPTDNVIIGDHLPVSGEQVEIIDRGWHYRLRRFERPVWAERLWQDERGVLHLAHAEGALFALQPAGPERPEALWRCVENPWPWARALGVDAYGLWAELRLGEARQRLRWIAPGRFRMGSPPDEPERYDDETPHTVTLTRGYWLADTACTQALWQAVTGENPAHFTDSADHPVEQVSWEDCHHFLERANESIEGFRLRLPSEAEWEYACRAGSDGPFSWGNTLATDQANYHGDYPYNHGPKGEQRRRTLPVERFAPNRWGLYQMHGNVLEWCQDWLGDYPEGEINDPAGPARGRNRVLRGGSWAALGRSLRSAQRSGSPPGGRGDSIGFRLAGGFDPQAGEGAGGMSADRRVRSPAGEGLKAPAGGHPDRRENH